MEPTKDGCIQFKQDSAIFSLPGSTLRLDLTALGHEDLLFVVDADSTPFASGKFVEPLRGGSVAELEIAERVSGTTFPFLVVALERPQCRPVTGTLTVAMIAKLVDIIEHDN